MPGDRFIELAMNEDRHVLDVLFKHAREGVTVQDQSGRLVYANDTAAQMVGFNSGMELVAAPAASLLDAFEMIDESGSPVPFDVLPGRRVLSGEKASEMTVGYQIRGSKRVRWSRVNASPIKNDAGDVVWAVNFFFDITEQVRHREGDSLMARVSDALGAALDIEENLLALADVLVPDYANWCAIHMIDGERHYSSVATKYSSASERLRYVITDKQQTALEPELIQSRVARTGEPELISDWDREILGQDPSSLRQSWTDLPAELANAAVACVPIGLRSSPLGSLTVARGKTEGTFDEFDVELLIDIGERAGVALANARLYQQEYETAKALQRGLMPAFLPETPGLDFAARYVPLALAGHVGGDFYDIVNTSPDRCVISVGDIEGKGVLAAAAVGLARHTLRATVLLDPEPEVVMGQLNRALRYDHPTRMCTLAYLVLDRQLGHFELHASLAGHPPPLVISSSGQIAPIGSPCPPLGLLDSVEPFQESVKLLPGDTVLAYTDGFAARDQTPPETLIPMLAGAESEQLEDLLDRLLSDLGQSENRVRDDVVLLAVRITE